nr:MAG TPA: hypothetical protein [Microviridae sp.]
MMQKTWNVRDQTKEAIEELLERKLASTKKKRSNHDAKNMECTRPDQRSN